jgi:hypothetical protein
VREVEEFTITAPAAIMFEPIVTIVLPGTKLVPVIVTEVPPATGPNAGLSEETVTAELL